MFQYLLVSQKFKTKIIILYSLILKFLAKKKMRQQTFRTEVWQDISEQTLLLNFSEPNLISSVGNSLRPERYI